MSCGEQLIRRFSENFWPNPGFDIILLPKAFYSSLFERATEKQKVNLVSSFDFEIQEVAFGE